MFCGNGRRSHRRILVVGCPSEILWFCCADLRQSVTCNCKRSTTHAVIAKTEIEVSSSQRFLWTIETISWIFSGHLIDYETERGVIVIQSSCTYQRMKTPSQPQLSARDDSEITTQGISSSRHVRYSSNSATFSNSSSQLSGSLSNVAAPSSATSSTPLWRAGPSKNVPGRPAGAFPSC